MNNKTNKKKSRNVTPKALIQAAFVVTVMSILFWYKETGSKIANLLFALIVVLIPVIAIIYYLKVPHSARRKAEQQANEKVGWLVKGLVLLVILVFLLSFVAAYLLDRGYI
jgi:F0F1-type ATP synthase assembly protein I